MGFSRATAIGIPPRAFDINAAMAGIGMNFAVEPDGDADIETTLVRASELGMEVGDYRVLGVLTAWMGIHIARVNADRLIRLVSTHPSVRVRAYWSAVAVWQTKDRRFARLMGAHKGPRIDLLSAGTEFRISRRGEDERFRDSALRVPGGVLRDRESDVLSPSALVRFHVGYRNRVLIGPTWRADVWTVLEREPGLRVADVARHVGCSFATAWQVARDHALWRNVTSD
ncbi:MAG: hypothetical protein IT350_10270 [Deltaproteobacteria bacterium]|nr:hypothetical protein [Deltaproteobacteria bacterium]